MSLVTLPRHTSVEELCATIERDGGVIIEELIDAQALAGLRNDLLPVLDALHDGPDDFAGYKTKRAGAIFRRTRHADALMLHPLMVGGAILPPTARGCLVRPGAGVGDPEHPARRIAGDPDPLRGGTPTPASRRLRVPMAPPQIRPRSAVPAHVGCFRLHRRERRNARRARQPQVGRRTNAARRRGRVDGDGGWLRPALHRIHVPWWRHQQHGRAADRAHADVRPRDASSGREPVSVGTAGRRPRARSRAPAHPRLRSMPAVHGMG